MTAHGGARWHGKVSHGAELELSCNVRSPLLRTFLRSLAASQPRGVRAGVVLQGGPSIKRACTHFDRLKWRQHRAWIA